MPKRRMTAKRKRQIARWQAASHTKQHWPPAVEGSFGHVRRHKLGGKAYQKKSGGFTIHESLAKVLGHG